MSTKKIAVQVTVQFRGFGRKPLEYEVLTSSNPGSPRWGATLERISDNQLERVQRQRLGNVLSVEVDASEAVRRWRGGLVAV
ncbi:MAG: hypothetical protein ACO3X1_14900 [Burkholderiaceae bacterium]